MGNAPSEKARKLIKLNAYEKFLLDFEKIVIEIIDENINVLNFRENLKKVINNIINDVKGNELFFIQMLSYVEPPFKFTSHSINTTIFSYIIASQLNIEIANIKKIMQAALLHDVGKLDFSETIKELYIYKTDERSDITKKHPLWGNRILLYHLKTDPDIAELVLNHHERNDGSGYPRGLTEKELTLSDGVLITANLLDNIISKTNYSGYNVLSKNVEILLSDYGNKIFPQIKNILHEIFTLKEDNRMQRRLKIKAKCIIENIHTKSYYPCEITNISSGGLEISTATELHDAFAYKITSRIAGDLYIKDKVCKVMWNKSAPGKFTYGLKFDFPNENIISNLVNNINIE